MANATIDIISPTDNKELRINYECRTDRTVFSIADFDGNVVKRGDCHDVKDGRLDISDLSRGQYTFCIIDGDNLIKARFQKNQ